MPDIAPPQTIDEFHARVAASLDDLPKRLRQCADYVAANSDRIAVSTVAEMAAKADVPPSALMRFCQILGFSGFSEMQKLFRDAYSPSLPDYGTRLANLKSSGAGSPALLLAEFIESGRLSLETLANSANEAALVQAVQLLAGAGTLHIIGSRRSYPVAAYLSYVFENLNIPAMLHDGAGRLAHSHAVREGDALIAISFAPYSAETLELAAIARARGVVVVALTDSLASPLAQHSNAVLPVFEVDFGAFRALTATIALALALAVAVAAARD
jgi:DNA-binding MurR/RpiR family transcriptional regulator